MAEAKELVAAAIARAQADLQDALAELEKMPALDPTSVAFAAHALNNYLTVTEGTVELILGDLGDQANAQLRVWLEGIHHATRLMARTVSQLMSTSVAPETKLRFEQFDLPLLVQRTCSYYRRLAERKGIHLPEVTAVEVPPVWADRVAVVAVLDNLLSNAIKYSDPGKQVRVQVWGEQGWAVCSVRDEGPGLSQEDQAKLFQKGVRLTPRPTGGEVSTGYGLAVAKELIDKLSGAIWCESVLGQGCCFLFRLPAYHEPIPVPEPTPAGPQTGPDAAS